MVHMSPDRNRSIRSSKGTCTVQSAGSQTGSSSSISRVQESSENLVREMRVSAA
jgi:hypothetical protein